MPVVVGGTALGLVIANQDSGEFESAEAFVLLAGGAALLVNGVWSVVTAVGDANAHNRSITIGELEIEPTLRLLPGSRVGIEIARLRF